MVKCSSLTFAGWRHTDLCRLLVKGNREMAKLGL